MSTYPATADLPQTASVVARYLLDEASGNAIDEVGALDLTDTNTVTAGTGYTAPGATFDNSRDFESGNSESFTHADNAAFDLTAAFTLSCFANIESTGATKMLISKDVTNLAYFLTINTGQAIEFRVSPDGGATTKTVDSGANQLSTGTWKHITAVYVPSTRMTLYFDGVEVGEVTATVPASVFNSGSGFFIGRNTGGNYMDGLMQDVIIWKGAALTDAEVTELYDLYQTAQNAVSGSPIFFT